VFLAVLQAGLGAQKHAESFAEIRAQSSTKLTFRTSRCAFWRNFTVG
jgi:hypothetical protein